MPYRIRAAALIILSFFSAVVDAFSVTLVVPLLATLQNVENMDNLPQFLQPLLRVFAPFPPEQQILLLIGAVFLAVILKNGLFGFSIVLAHWITGRMVADMRLEAVDLLLHVDVSYLRQSHTGKHIDNIMSNTSHVELWLRSTSEMLVSGIMVGALVTLMLAISWQYALVTLGSLLLIALLIAGYMRGLTSAGHRNARMRAELAAILAETLHGNILVRYLAKEQAQIERVRHTIEAVRVRLQRRQTRSYLVSNITEVMGIFVVATLLTYATLSGHLATPAGVTGLLVFLVVLVKALPSVKELSRTRGFVAANYPYLTRVAALLDRTDKPFMADGKRQFTPLRDAIRFQTVTFTYPDGNRPILHDIDLTIAKGQKIALVGESGSGKTTLIHLLMRLYNPDSGAIWIDDVRLPQLEIASLRRAIGIVSQDTFLFDDTAYNNIAYGAVGEVSREQVIAAAKQAHAHTFIQALPNSYETLLGEGGARLSGGQRQRIAIARTILRDPEILILDEATSSLDNATEQAVHQALMALSRNRTVIIIAHRFSTIYDADQIAVLRNGRIVEIGERASLLQTPDSEYARLAKMTQ